MYNKRFLADKWFKKNFQNKFKKNKIIYKFKPKVKKKKKKIFKKRKK